MSPHHVRRAAVIGPLALLLLVGCGGGPSGEEMGEAFARQAKAAYAEDGADRDREYSRGVQVDDCFVLDQEGAEAIAKALGEDDDITVNDSSFLVGAPGEEERLSCSIVAGDEGVTSVSAGSTLADPKIQLARLLRRDGAEEIEKTASDLDDEVVAVETDGVITVAWTDERFSVALSVLTDEHDVDAALDALSAAVDAVEAALG